MTTLPETVQEETQHPPPSPWSTPRPDGPLAAALRRAQAARSAVEAEPPLGTFDAPLPLTADAPPPSRESLEHDIEALAREAQSRDGVREALAIALEWPAGTAEPRRMHAWRGWIALGGVLVLAGAAAAVALAFTLGDPLPDRARGELKLERQLQVPHAGPPGTVVR